MKPHKWAKEIKAWADGAEIEVYNNGIWEPVQNPWWITDNEYRIKPTPKEPQYLYVYANGVVTVTSPDKEAYSGIPYIGKIKLEDEDE